jgi:membrane-associated phospholipid phosphatase
MHYTQRRIREIALCTAAAAVLLAVSAPRAEAQSRPDELELSYLWDGGAIPFLWGSLAARWGVERAMDPPDSPRFFSANDGGMTSMKSRELPGLAVTAGAGLLSLSIAFDDDESRWFHFKGFVQSVATTALLTSIGKNAFGRHRPDYDPSNPSNDSIRSFPSGHSSQALSAATYTVFYLRRHGFDSLREPGTLPWWEAATYLSIGALALAVPVERVYHNRHHATDALAGSLLGAATSTAFFIYQERRYRRAKNRDSEIDKMPMIAPSFDRPGIELMWQF